MRPVGTLAEAKQARMFGDYLTTLGIRSSVEASEKGWTIWVRNEGDVRKAVMEFRQFCANPDDDRYAGVRGAADAARREAERDEERRRRNVISPRQEWFTHTRSVATGFRRETLWKSRLTLALIAVCVGVALATSLGSDHNEVMNALLIAPVAIHGNTIAWNGLSEVLHGQAWRLVTPIFLHFGVLHILFNMWWLKDLGSMIESRKGPLKLAALVLVSAVASNLVEYAWDGPLAGGFSGVIYALFGYVWMKGRFEPGEGMAASRTDVAIMIGWLFYCMTGWAGPIGNAAHLSGLAVGMLAGWAPHRLLPRRA